MAEQFNEEDRDELIERGFNNDQIEYLESLEMDPEGLFADICKIMDDFGDTPEQIIDSYREANNNPPFPSQGGRRRTRKNRKGRKSHKRKSHKRKSHKRRSHKRRSHKRRY